MLGPKTRTCLYVSFLVLAFLTLVIGLMVVESKREKREIEKNASMILEWKINTLDECQKEIISPILRNYKTQKDIVIIMGEEFTHPQDILSKIFVLSSDDRIEVWYEESKSFFPRKLGDKYNYNSETCVEKNKLRPPEVIMSDSLSGIP